MTGKAGKNNKVVKIAGSTAFARAARSAGMTPQPGKSAVQATYRDSVNAASGFAYTESLDLDAHFQSSEPHSHRWDYAVGIRSSSGVEMAFWLEPHPASSTSEVGTMIQKLLWLQNKLKQPAFAPLRKLRDEAAKQKFPTYRWLVTSTGDIRIKSNSREARLLAQAGLVLPCRRIELP